MFYEFSGKDSSSDFGSFIILIEAATKKKAEEIANAHLIKMGKGAYCNCKRVVGPILYSNVEASNVQAAS